MNIYKGMTNEERACYGKENFIQMKYMLDTGIMSQKEYMWFYMEYLMNLIKKVIKEKTYILPGMQGYEDLLNEGITAIAEKVMDYNPEIAGPSTFFKPYIEERIQRYLRPEYRSAYYDSTIRKLDKVAKERGYDNCTDERLSAYELSVYANIALTTVLEARNQAAIIIDALETFDENIMDERTCSPEDIFIKKEEQQELVRALKSCTPLEQFLLLSIGVDGDSVRKVQEFLKLPEQLEKFRDELPKKVPQDYLMRKYHQGCRRMRGNIADEQISAAVTKKAMAVIKNLHLNDEGIDDIFEGFFF